MKINLRITLLAAWFGFLLFTGTAIYSLLGHQYGLAFGLFMVAAIGFFMLFYFANVEIDDNGIRQKALSGSYEIKWDEIKQVELREPSPGAVTSIVFRGENKVLTVLGPAFWSSDDAAMILDFIFLHMEERDIRLMAGSRSFRFPKHTKL